MLRRKCNLLLLFLLTAVPLLAAPAKRGWTKVELTRADGNSGPFPSNVLAGFGAEPVADYGAFAIVSVPQGAVDAATQHAAKHGIRVRMRDELDMIHLPGASVDAREGITDGPPGKIIREYPPRKPGLFVLQFIGPVRGEWIAELEKLGWTLSRYIPNDAYLVVGQPELMGRTRQLAFVQWLDFFHPYQKAAFLARDGAPHDQLFELPAGSDAAGGVEAIRSAAQGEIEVRHGSADTLVFARMTDDAAEALLQHELIISVSPRPDGLLSDERQVMSLTANLNAAQSQPTSPGLSWNWVLSRCSDCGNMPASSWRVGLADTGLDDGANFIASGHPDLSGRKYYGQNLAAGAPDEECAPGQLLCDAYGHGTPVAGIAAGDGSMGPSDTAGFLLGRGAAPTAGVFMTKAASRKSGGRFNISRFFEITADAANNGVAIQNHSWNDYTLSVSGKYSTVSRNFDIATRDADDTLSGARIPILFTVSAGNNNQGAGPLTLPGATAKNVLAMGGLENDRPEHNGDSCAGTRGDGFRNVMSASCIGTALAGYIKPDLMAPASLIVSTKSSILWSNPSSWCLNEFEGHFQYTGHSGTSFAAPVGAGAALIVKRYLGSSPTATSPALAKAVLIAGARSVRGGEDRTHTPATTIGPVPSQQQGFGRISLVDILNGSQKPVWFDQSPSRLFTQTGQIYRLRLRARDFAKPVKIALVWTDAPATAFVSNPLVNDLNLEVRLSNSNVVYVGNSLRVAMEGYGEESIAHPSSATPPYDNVNNVEYFRLFMSLHEEFEVTVKLWNLAGDTDPSLPGFEQDFALAVLNADILSGGNPIPPILSAQTSASFSSTVNLSWTPASNMMITTYEVYRGTKLYNLQLRATTQGTTFVDSPPNANTTYIYRVVASGPGGTAASNNDVATTIQWQSTPGPGTPVKAEEFTELRQGIDYVRFAADLPTATWAEAIAPGVIIRASHMNEMRAKLEQALAAIGAPLPDYVYPAPTAGVSLIHDEDVIDLRNSVH